MQGNGKDWSDKGLQPMKANVDHEFQPITISAAAKLVLLLSHCLETDGHHFANGHDLAYYDSSHPDAPFSGQSNYVGEGHVAEARDPAYREDFHDEDFETKEKHIKGYDSKETAVRDALDPVGMDSHLSSGSTCSRRLLVSTGERRGLPRMREQSIYHTGLG
ncbi:hypothetical protein K503DRAFT_786976 [Rhizopogon vinicolor AM-OR11-026]|uniref:Uncharacterized protein n=1 Tax=Rhizopogon vinicolor AM-OR11-026 TaxID=1314800 RepID=A0A1B7MJK1_9AGAM|nr:hypothetical protein K503DRAFT_786976 [Rhizopogon vinicolor AM-OR11-026]